MTTLADKVILSGADNRPPMLEKDMRDSWKSIMELYLINRKNVKKYYELSHTDAIQADYDIKATNIILQGLLPEVYALGSNHKIAKDLWERIQLLLQGTSLAKQERECKLYDEFDKFAYKKEETLCDFYLIFSILLNDMNIYKVKQEQFQVNTKFLNTLPPEWNKFTTDSQQYSTNQSLTPFSITYPTNDYQSSVHHNVYSPQPSTPQLEYAPTVNQQPRQPEFPQLDSGLTVLVFKQGDDLIDAINHMMSFLSAVVTSRYPSTNNQLRNSSNLGKKLPLMILDVLTKVHNPDNIDNNMINQSVQAMSSSEQSSVVNHSETEITSDSSIIPYSQYVHETQQAVVHNSDSSAQQDVLILSVIEQLKTQVINCTKINLENKSVNDTLTVELERYKEQVKVLKEGQKVEKAHQLEPKLYDGNVIKNTYAIMIPDSKETLMLAEESRSKIILKQQDPMVLEKKVNTTPVDYSALNQLYPSPSCTPTRVEVLKELPKVSMTNTSLKKLKHYLAGFDVVVKERTTVTAITEGLWGFEYTKACFRDEIIPFVKALKDIFNTFDQYLIDELTEVQNVFHQMEQAVEQHRLE
nr:hypothetical protein [Tanacetum cinerariifolium]